MSLQRKSFVDHNKLEETTGIWNLIKAAKQRLFVTVGLRTFGETMKRRRIKNSNENIFYANGSIENTSSFDCIKFRTRL